MPLPGGLLVNRMESGTSAWLGIGLCQLQDFGILSAVRSRAFNGRATSPAPDLRILQAHPASAGGRSCLLWGTRKSARGVQRGAARSLGDCDRRGCAIAPAFPLLLRAETLASCWAVVAEYACVRPATGARLTSRARRSSRILVSRVFCWWVSSGSFGVRGGYERVRPWINITRTVSFNIWSSFAETPLRTVSVNRTLSGGVDTSRVPALMHLSQWSANRGSTHQS